MQLLRTSSLEAKPYVIEDHKVLYVVQTGPMDMLKVRNFLLDQAEVWEFEYESCFLDDDHFFLTNLLTD